MNAVDPPEWIKLPIGWLLGAIASLLGGWDQPLQLMAIAQVADIVFGTWAGTKTEGFMPRKLADGIARKVGYWFVVVIAFSIDQYIVYQGMKSPVAVHEMAVLGFFVADTISALTNASIIGIPVPVEVLKYVAKLKDTANEVSGALPLKPRPQ